MDSRHSCYHWMNQHSPRSHWKKVPNQSEYKWINRWIMKSLVRSINHQKIHLSPNITQILCNMHWKIAILTFSDCIFDIFSTGCRKMYRIKGPFVDDPNNQKSENTDTHGAIFKRTWTQLTYQKWGYYETRNSGALASMEVQALINMCGSAGTYQYVWHV